MHIAAIDCGRSNVKAVGQQQADNFRTEFRDQFPAHVKPWKKLRLERRPNRNDMVVDYNNKVWYVGEIAKDEAGGEGSQMMLASKAHNDTRVLILAMLHRMLPNTQDTHEVFLMTGVPIEHPDGEKERLRQLMLGEHHVTMNGTHKNIRIIKVEVATECATAAWAMKRGGTFTLVDPGSRTVNFATMHNGRWWDERSGTLNYGAESLDLDKAQVVRQMMADLSRRLRTIPHLVVMGGNAEEYAHEIRQYHQDTEVHPDPMFANAQAYYELGVMAFERAKNNQAKRPV